MDRIDLDEVSEETREAIKKIIDKEQNKLKGD